MPEFYTWIILLINQSDEIGEKQLSVFGSRGGQICPLMHAPLSFPSYKTGLLGNFDDASSTKTCVWYGVYHQKMVVWNVLCLQKMVLW